MKRDINKLLNEYGKLKKGKSGNFGSFYASEIYEIREMAEKDGPRIGDILFDAITKSLNVGFIVGYKAGLREARKRQNG